MIKAYTKYSDLKAGRFFKAYEFDCGCKNPECQETLISQELLDRLDRMRIALDCPLHITSGFRCRAHQEYLKKIGLETATGISQHELGNAADVQTRRHKGPDLAFYARNAGFTSVGVGKRFIHVDTRKKHLAWGYNVRQK